MDDRQPDEARMPRSPSYVTERQLRTTLDESLWEVERLRVNPHPQPQTPSWRPPKGSAELNAASDGIDPLGLRQ
jgi:hypothetical protein